MKFIDADIMCIVHIMYIKVEKEVEKYIQLYVLQIYVQFNKVFTQNLWRLY